ncbi:MAG: aminoacrylate hydrolase, partial [Variibacter sp.]|nr:aminoacrylate hydrolase [Variibacter sp.]
MPSTTRDGAELYWEEDGDGPPLILAAGLGGAGTWWDVNRAALAARFKLYIFDQRGTGKSSKVPVASVEQMSADAIAIMDAAGLESAHYLGHSTGGAIGVATALDYPGRLRSLCVYASTTCGDPYRRRVLGLRNRLYQELGAQAYAQYSTLLLYPPYWINANDAKLAAAEAAAASQLGSANVQASRLSAILAFDRRAELGRIDVPTFVLCADDDILTPRYFSEEYARLIPNARSRWIERGGHALSRTEPDLFNRL